MTGIAGKGINRGTRIRFTFPGNCTAVGRSSAGTKMQNRTEAVGVYAVGKAESVESINKYKMLFEGEVSAPEQVVLPYLVAYASAETVTLENPFRILTFTPRSVTNSKSFSVPKPFEDYEIGDVVYCKIKKGKRLVVGIPNLQPVRIYTMIINIEETGTEKITGIQTTYESNG